MGKITTPTKYFALEIARTYLTRDMAARGWVAGQTEIVTSGNSRWLPTLRYGRCVLTMDGRVTTVKHADHLTAHPFDDVRDAVKFAEEWVGSEEAK